MTIEEGRRAIGILRLFCMWDIAFRIGELNRGLCMVRSSQVSMTYSLVEDEEYETERES